MHDKEPVGLVELTVYLRVYAMLIESGVSLMRCMHILDQSTTYEPLRQANKEIMDAVEGGETLSKSMCAHPELFSSFLIGLVRAGEVGGVLDETMRRAADFYQKQLDYRRQRYTLYATAAALGEETVGQYEKALEEVADDLLIQYFCHMFGTMLLSGVPLLQAMQVAAEVLPERQAEGIMKAREGLREGETSLAPYLVASGFPSALVMLFTIGEETGDLDRMALRAGDIIGAQVAGRLEASLGFN
ncbi:MAG: type II secretion system F family protein [Armatimonadia bacterium]